LAARGEGGDVPVVGLFVVPKDVRVAVVGFDSELAVYTSVISAQLSTLFTVGGFPSCLTNPNRLF
jgi:hypothetical protein